MRQIRERFGMPGIALSGYGMEEDINQSLDAGFLDHIVKPVDLERLKAAIHRAVSPAGAGAHR